MKVAIIGAGNMGAAIAKSIVSGFMGELTLAVSNPSVGKLSALKGEYPQIQVSTDNCEVAAGADVVIFAVKPVYIEEVISGQKGVLTSEQTMVSILGGLSLTGFRTYFDALGINPPLVRVIPDTAISIGKSMTFVSSLNAVPESVDRVVRLFATSGEVAQIPERLMDAATALSSCGIAYVFKYVQACVQAGVQMGFRPADAQKYVLQTIEGAVGLLAADGTTPQQEIDKVTSPGGMTIKGINMLEHCGFTSAIIKATIEPIK